MDKTRSRTRRLQPAFGGGIAALMAAMAMAYSMGGSHNSYPYETDHTGIGLSDTGDAPGNGGVGGGAGEGAGGASNGGGVHFLADGSHSPFGQNGEPGSGDGGDDNPGFMPNGENGLMTLASYVRGDDRGDGGGHHDGDAPSGDQHDGSGGDQQTAQNEHGAGGFGAPGGGLGAPGGGGGGGGTGPNGQDPTHPTDQGPHDPGSGPGGDHPFTPGDGPGGCVLGVGPACGGAPGDPEFPDFSPPKTFFGPNSDGPGGGDNPPVGHDSVVADGIPEPATWLTLILGLAVLGQSLRARRPKRLA